MKFNPLFSSNFRLEDAVGIRDIPLQNLKRTIIATLLACILGSAADARQSQVHSSAPTTPVEAANPPLHLADRIIEDAKLMELDGLSWKFKCGDTSDSAVTTQQIVRWGQWRGVIDRSAVWLSDGSWLAGEVSWSGPDQLTIQNRWLQLNPIPLRQIRGVVLLPAASLVDWIRIQQNMLATTGEDDVVWLKDRRQLAGVVDWSSLTTNTRLKLVTSGQEIVLPLEEIEAIAASPALFGPVPSAPIKIGLSDGSLLNANEVKSSDQRALIQLPSLKQLETLDRPNAFAEAIQFLSCERVPKVQHLDQLKPARYLHANENQLEYDLGVGKDVNGMPLRLGNRRRIGIAFHGLAMHSSSQAAYRWDRSPGRFLAEVRLAPSVNRMGTVLCKVLLAREGTLKTASEFPLDAVHGSTSHCVDIDIEDSQLVVLVVEKADKAQYGDQVFWLDARIATPQ